MKVFELTAPDGFRWLTPRETNAFSALWATIQNKPLSESWKPIEVLELTDIDGHQLAISDFPWLTNGVLALSEFAIKALYRELQNFGEILPLSCPTCKYHLFNSLTMLDALDMNQSEVLRLPNSERIISIETAVFIADVIGDIPIFHLPYPHPSKLYVTEGFLTVLDDKELIGFGAEMVWQG